MAEQQEKIREQLQKRILDFHLPRYEDIPDIGLYLEQVVRYVNEYLRLSGCPELTSSMVSNYVKQKVIPGPERKAYSARSLSYLMFVAYMKSVTSIDNLRLLMDVQRRSYDHRTAYNYFCDEFENQLMAAFGVREAIDNIGQTATSEKDLFRRALQTLALKIYLEQYLALLREENDAAAGTDPGKVQKETENVKQREKREKRRGEN